MTWREDARRVTITVNGQRKSLIGASFRGVAFFVESADGGGGRRTVSHEFPFREDPFVEDLGRRARVFHLDGYVIGDEYLDQRDALQDALEAEGPGELVHPYKGVLTAAVPNFSWRVTRADGGMATFAIDFQETPTQAPVPTEVVDGAEQVSSAADAAIDDTNLEFVEQYSAEGMPAFGLASAETAFKAAVAAFTDTLAPIVTATQELATLTGQIELLTAEASSLVRSPATIIGAFHDAIAGLVETAASAPFDLMEALFDTYLTDLGAPVVGNTAIRERELANQTALQNALRRVIAIEAARLAPTVSYESTDAATEARDRVTEMLDEQAALADDTSYPALVELRSQVLRAVPGSSEFARITTVTRATSVSSILLAYQLYGSTDLELDLVARNRVRHPGFMLGELKALSDG